MRRAKVTSGGDGKTSSKFKPPKKVPSLYYIRTGGELNIYSTHIILRERDLKTGEFTGKNYTIHLKSTKSNLPKKYRNAQKLEILCTISFRDNTFSKKSRNMQNFEYNPVYRIAHIFKLTNNDNKKFSNKKELNERNNLSFKEDVIKKISNDFDDSTSGSIFKYIGKKEEIERKVSDKIQSVIGGIREQITPDGEYIDLLVKGLLIEVKAASNWDDAIGQVLKYKIHFPKHKSVIFLFDDGWGLEKAKLCIEEIVIKFLSTNVYVATSIEDLKALL